MTDLPALIAAFKTDARYTQAVIDGRHGDLVGLINADQPTGRVWQAIPMATVKQILAPYLAGLTMDQRDTLRTFAGDNETLDLTRKGVRDTLVAMFSTQPQAITDLRAQAQRAMRFADDFGAESVSIADIRKAARQVPGSALFRYLDPTDPANIARAARSAIVARVGAKVMRLKQKMNAEGRGQEFAAFRFGGDPRFPKYANLPPGLYAQPEDQRESFLDAKMATEGVV